MFYTEKTPQVAAHIAMIEGRYKITQQQKTQLKDIEDRLNIPASALVRMALDSFLPRVGNSGFTDKGIKAGYLNGNY